MAAAKIQFQVAGGAGTMGIKYSFQFLAGFLVALVLIAIFYFPAGDEAKISEQQSTTKSHKINSSSSSSSSSNTLNFESSGSGSGSTSTSSNSSGRAGGYSSRSASAVAASSSSSSSSSCNLFTGKWVFDNQSYPLYREKQCSFMSDQLACEKYGRKDLTYQNWRWQPHQCDLPRFNATTMLERLRNKRLVYVGDSLNRGQWVSMVCLLDTAMPATSSRSMEYNGSIITFKALEYNASIEYYWAPLLVESNSDDPIHHKVPERIVRVQAIEKHARHWTDADILVFDSYLWWRRPTMKVLWGSFERDDGIYKEVKMLRSFEMALRTWADWLEIHVNRSKTQIFWVTMSPTHEMAEEWGGDAGSNCYNETQQIFRQGYMGSGSDPKMIRIVEAAIEDLCARGLKVEVINITQLSEYRKEAHPSVNRKQWEPLTEKQLADPLSYADCDHWCLPGVPDTWNELLFALLFSTTPTDS